MGLWARTAINDSNSCDHWVKLGMLLAFHLREYNERKPHRCHFYKENCGCATSLYFCGAKYTLKKTRKEVRRLVSVIQDFLSANVPLFYVPKKRTSQHPHWCRKGLFASFFPSTCFVMVPTEVARGILPSK